MNIIESNLSFGVLSKRRSTRKVITHHADAISCSIQDVDMWHKNNGWDGIGYHFFIRKDGSVYRGRPIDTIGAHTIGQNSDSIGICLEGRLTEEKPTGDQISVLKDLIRYIKANYGNIPVYGHKNFINTDCPGVLMDYMQELNGVSQGINPLPQQPVQAEEKKTWEHYIFGDLVKRLQHELNVQFNARLDEDGYLGDKTLDVLKAIVIKKGAHGNMTKLIQERLIQLGYSLTHFGADSDFGGETENAVRQFQKDRGLTPDAVVGINTFKELFRR